MYRFANPARFHRFSRRVQAGLSQSALVTRWSACSPARCGVGRWGTYWVWDARLTSMLLLCFLYLGHIALSRAHDNAERGDRGAAILALIGVINLPVIKFSVDWW